MTDNKERNFKYHNAIFRYALLAAVLLILSSATVGVLAKYVRSDDSAYKQADIAEFYFLTDLEENTPDDPYPVYDGNIEFTVMNHDLLNICQRNISYNVSVNGSTHTSNASLSGNVKSEKKYSVTAQQDGDYTVEIKSTAPYAKTIKLYFRVNTHYDRSFYTVTKHVGWVELDIYTGKDSGDITVAYGNLQPDNTIALTSDWKAGASKSGTLTSLKAYSHYKLIFFGDYNDENDPFTLTQSGETLTKGE